MSGHGFKIMEKLICFKSIIVDVLRDGRLDIQLIRTPERDETGYLQLPRRGGRYKFEQELNDFIHSHAIIGFINRREGKPDGSANNE